MKFLLVQRTHERKLKFTPGESSVVNSFCQARRDDLRSLCETHYNTMFSSLRDQKRTFVKCPYGLESIGLIKWTETDRIASGFFTKQNTGGRNLPANVMSSATTDEATVKNYLQRFDAIVREYHDESYAYLESAIHDVRHINATITAHAERLLKLSGYDIGAGIDLTALNRDERDKKALSIYSSSRDLSAALSLHEIAIDPSRAEDERITCNLHKLFYRQKQISSDRLEQKNLQLILGPSDHTIRVTKSFGLLPIILLHNAIKYSQSNSKIEVNFADAGGYFRIICTNEGPIVREDEVEKIFEKNYRGSNRTGIPGHGIGLWLAFLIVTANLGRISMACVERGRDLTGRRIGQTTVTVSLLKSG